MKKITFDELRDILTEDSSKEGVIVFKQNVDWKEEYSLEERSYKVSGDNKFFKSYLLGNSLFGTNLTGTDKCVRLDWYMKQEENPWLIDYCYIIKK